MSNCGCDAVAETEEQRRILRLALVLNAVMFVVGFIAGVIAQSTGLIADSLDMLADAFAYGIGLIAIARSATFKATAATVSGTLLLVLGVGVLIDVARRAIVGANPESTTMLLVASVSLVVNSIVLHLLSRYRRGEVHLRATWIFTRADVIANIAVITAALIVRYTQAEWVDLVVGALIGCYVAKEALEILANGRKAARSATT